MLKQVERTAAVGAAAGKVKIGMSVGAHSDVFRLAAAGLPEERALSFVLGRGAELTARAEAQADRGQLAVSAATRALLPDGRILAPSGDFWLVDGSSVGDAPGAAAKRPAAADDRAVAASPPASAAQLRRLAPFLPPYARPQDGEGGGTRGGAGGTRGGFGGGRVEHPPEHRRTVIAFVDILGLDEIIEGAGIAAALRQLQAYSAMLARLAGKHRGFVVSSDIATEGSKLVITFGTPVAHEYAPANAARFTLDLTDELRGSGLDLSHRIGVNGGHVFAGEVGPPFRRQYTVMGDAVNLAARLMSAAAPGEALISRNLLDYVSPDLCARELEPIKVKGKEQPVGVCVLEEKKRRGHQIHGGARTGHAALKLFGRRAELRIIRRSWEDARRGEGRVLLMEGEAGVGKTRLVEEALNGMSDAGRVTRAACFEHLQAAPYTPWIDVLYSILEVAPKDTVDRRTDRVQAYLQTRLVDLVELGSLLNPLLALSIPQSDLVRSLDVRTRRQKLFEMICGIVAEAGGDSGEVLVVEDLHWMDESSLALVDHLSTHLEGARVLLLLTTRPSDGNPALESAEVTKVVLDELTEHESLAMVREALGVKDPAAEIGEAIFARTKGNPLFLEEVIHSLQAPGVLDRVLSASSVTRAAELALLAIPDRVQGLLMSRIDHLAPDTREVLKVGSVVGRSFDTGVLDGIGDDPLRAVSIGRAFDELIEATLMVPVEEGASSVTFRHALVQDVAYESIPFARRRDLHDRVGRYLESVHTSPDHGLLVHHYSHASNAAETRIHAAKAAEASVAVYAHPEAVDYLRLGLKTVHGRTPADACMRSRFEELIGDCLEGLARQSEAIERYVRARSRWRSPKVRMMAPVVLREISPIEDGDARESDLCWKIALSAERGQSAYQRALRWLDKAASVLPPDRTALAARICITKCVSLSRLGRYDQALPVGEEGLRLAREDGDTSLLAYALAMIVHPLFGLGLLERAIEADLEAVRLYADAGDLAGQASAEGNLAACYQLTGDLPSALEHHQLSLALDARRSYTTGVAIAHGNLGELLLQMGDADGALVHLRQAISYRDDQGVPPSLIGFALVNLCRALLRAGQLEAAEQALADGRQVLRGIDAKSLLLDAGVLEAELQLAQGDFEHAGRLCRAVLADARSMGADLTETQALCVQGRIQLAQGDSDAAIPGLEACVALAEKTGSDYERGQALVVLAEARAACAEPDQACEDLLLEAIRLFRKMGAGYDLEKALETRERLQLRV